MESGGYRRGMRLQAGGGGSTYMAADNSLMRPDASLRQMFGRCWMMPGFLAHCHQVLHAEAQRQRHGAPLVRQVALASGRCAHPTVLTSALQGIMWRW